MIRKLLRSAEHDGAAIGNIRQEIILRSHDSLRLTGGAGGVHDRRQIASVHRFENFEKAPSFEAGAQFGQLCKGQGIRQIRRLPIHNDDMGKRGELSA